MTLFTAIRGGSESKGIDRPAQLDAAAPCPKDVMRTFRARRRDDDEPVAIIVRGDGLHAGAGRHVTSRKTR